jgi:hypothetical protein
MKYEHSQANLAADRGGHSGDANRVAENAVSTGEI